MREEIAKQQSDNFSKCVSANHVPISEKELLVKQLEVQNLKVLFLAFLLNKYEMWLKLLYFV